MKIKQCNDFIHEPFILQVEQFNTLITGTRDPYLACTSITTTLGVLKPDKKF